MAPMLGCGGREWLTGPAPLLGPGGVGWRWWRGVVLECCLGWMCGGAGLFEVVCVGIMCLACGVLGGVG